MDDGFYTETSKISLGEWLDIYLAEYTNNIKSKTLKDYNVFVRRIKPVLGAIKLKSIQTPQIQAFYNRLQRKGLAPKSIKNIHGVLHVALKQAVEVGYLRFNPSDACKLPRINKTLIKPLDENDIDRFLQAIKGHEYERLFFIALFTGMRQAEILGLTWDCIDFQKGTIFIYRQLQLINGKYDFTTLKNEKTRLITPAHLVIKELQEEKRIQAEWRLIAGQAWEGDNFVFCNSIGQHLARQTVYQQFKRVVSSIGLPETRFHDLRHSYAVSALQSGDDVKTIQQNLGHHTAAFTLDIYGHVTEQMKKESAARMDAFINRVTRNKNL